MVMHKADIDRCEFQNGYERPGRITGRVIADHQKIQKKLDRIDHNRYHKYMSWVTG